MTAKKVTVHNTDNSASAANEVSYHNSNNAQVSFHVAIDEKEAIQCVPFNRNAWAAGDGANGYGNRNTIHFEICRNYDRARNTTNLGAAQQAEYIKAEVNAVKVIAAVMKQQGIAPTTDNVKRHYDWSGKWCPSKILNEARWPIVQAFIVNEAKRLYGQTVTAPATSTKSATSKTNTTSYKEEKFATPQITDDALNVRKEPNTTSAIVGSLAKGKTFTPTKIVKNGASVNGYTTWCYNTEKKGWVSMAYTTPTKTTTTTAKTTTTSKKSNDTIAKEVINGKWGNGTTRINKLKAAGYNPTTIQALVDKKLGKTTTTTKKKTNAQIAMEIYKGQGGWGTGTTRTNKLKAAGYDPVAVQKEVNKLF